MPALETLVNNVRRNIFVPGTKVISMEGGGGGITKGVVYTVKSHHKDRSIKLEELNTVWAPLMSRFKKANV